MGGYVIGPRQTHLEAKRTARSKSSVGGDDGTRTHDPRLAKPVLFQLSYVPSTRPILAGYRGFSENDPGRVDSYLVTFLARRT